VPGIARRGLSPLALKSGPSFEEIAKKYKLSDEQKRTYAQRKMTGEAYFRGLSAEEQRKILGPAKWLAWKEGKFEFTQLAKKTYSPVWGAGRGAASLASLVGETEAELYKKFIAGFKGNDYYSVAGIRLTYERLGHIFERHPEVGLTTVASLFREAVEHPLSITPSNSDPNVSMNYVKDEFGRYWSFVIKKSDTGSFLLTVRRAHEQGK